MLKELISKLFNDYESADASEAKYVFSIVWGALASKIVLYNGVELQFSWRELSSELVSIYNEWYDCDLINDAFVKSYDVENTYGKSDGVYNTILKILYDNTQGIFIVNQTILKSSDEYNMCSFTDVITGEVKYYKTFWESGEVKSRVEISRKEYEKECYE